MLKTTQSILFYNFYYIYLFLEAGTDLELDLALEEDLDGNFFPGGLGLPDPACANLGLKISMVEAAVTAAYLPTFNMASLRDILSSEPIASVILSIFFSKMILFKCSTIKLFHVE